MLSTTNSSVRPWCAISFDCSFSGITPITSPPATSAAFAMCPISPTFAPPYTRPIPRLAKSLPVAMAACAYEGSSPSWLPQKTQTRRKGAIPPSLRWPSQCCKRYSETVRIVSLCPSITETLIDFGLRDRLVGVTRFCIHPAAVVKDLPKVGGTKNPDHERIDEAAPDLVFVNAEENRREDYALLSQKYRVHVSMPRSVAEVPDDLRRFGALVGAEEIAKRRARELETALRELDAL